MALPAIIYAPIAPDIQTERSFCGSIECQRMLGLQRLVAVADPTDPVTLPTKGARQHIHTARGTPGRPTATPNSTPTVRSWRPTHAPSRCTPAKGTIERQLWGKPGNPVLILERPIRSAEWTTIGHKLDGRNAPVPDLPPSRRVTDSPSVLHPHRAHDSVQTGREGGQLG
jgi:hypothetical protein